MTHREKIRWMMEDLEKRGVGRWTSAPPIFRLLWRMGGRVPPPCFLPWGRLVLVFGIPFGVGATVVSVLGVHLVASARPLPALESRLATLAWAVGPLCGAGFGAGMAFWTRRRASALALPPWHAYGFGARAPEAFS